MTKKTTKKHDLPNNIQIVEIVTDLLGFGYATEREDLTPRAKGLIRDRKVARDRDRKRVIAPLHPIAFENGLSGIFI